MNDQKDLLEQFMHHNMPEKSIDPDEVFARTYQVLPDDYEPSKKFTRNMKKLLRKAKWMSYKNSVKRFFSIQTQSKKLLPSRKGRAAAFLSVELIGADGGGCAPREWPRCRNGWGPRREDAPRWHERCLLRGGVPFRYGPPAEPPFPPNETCPACSRSFVGTTSSGGVSAT